MAFTHRFGASLNPHPHFHVCVIDSLFVPNGESDVRFVGAAHVGSEDAEAVQSQVRHRVLPAFVRCGLLGKTEREEMKRWNYGGGFSLDVSIRVERSDRRGLERRLRYCALPPFTAERLEALDRQRLI